MQFGTTVWLERLVEARKNRKIKSSVHTELTENHTMMLNLVKTGGTGLNFVTKSSQHKNLKSNRLWIISIAKFLQENLVGKSCGKFCGKVCGKILWEIFVGNSVGKFAGNSYEYLTGNSCRKILREILWEIWLEMLWEILWEIM